MSFLITLIGLSYDIISLHDHVAIQTHFLGNTDVVSPSYLASSVLSLSLAAQYATFPSHVR
jgi:hypothetical protein